MAQADMTVAVTVTNAQTALAAASRVYSGGRGYSRDQVLELAAEFLTWLDARDADAANRPAGAARRIG